MLKTVRRAFQIEDIRKRTLLYICNAYRCKAWITAAHTGR